jgi:hypothetical protein
MSFALSGAHGAALDLSLESVMKSIESIEKEVLDAGLPPPNLRGYECDTSSEETYRKLFGRLSRTLGKSISSVPIQALWESIATDSKTQPFCWGSQERQMSRM